MFRAALLLLMLAQTARAECTMHRAAELPLTLWRDKLYVPVSIDGATRMMFVDTGASVTTLAAKTADALSLPRDFDHTADMFGVGGQESHLYLVHTRTLSLGGITARDQTYPVAEFTEMMADGATPVGGLIGADLLSHFDLELDVPNRRLGLWQVTGCSEVTPDWTGASGSVPVEVLPSRHVSVPVRADETVVNLLLDTGAPGVVLSTRAAARAGATPEVLEESRRMSGRGVNERAFQGWVHIIARLDVAGDIFGDARAAVVNNGRVQGGDGLLGLAFLKRGRVWISYATGRLFLERGVTE